MSNDINKLPKWAKDYIGNLEMQRDAAVRALNDYTDNQTPTRVYFEELVCAEKTPVFKKVYIQNDEVTFDLDPDNPNRDTITVRLGRDEEEKSLLISAGWNAISIQPNASNQIRLKGTR